MSGRARLGILCGMGHHTTRLRLSADPQNRTWPVPPEQGTGAGLIVYIDDSPFWIGCEQRTSPIYNEVIVEATGELSFGMNDCVSCFGSRSDNDGELIVNVTINH